MKPILLTRHPETPSAPMKLLVRFGRSGGILRARFRLPGDNQGVELPESRQNMEKIHPELRADELWRHTCFEIFIRPSKSTEYIEFNFSPSGQWAAYHFSNRRRDMQNADVAVPAIIATDRPSRFELSALVELPDWKEVDWEANFTAIIEEKDGTKSYWALAHPAGPPDFHDPSCFIARLPE